MRSLMYHGLGDAAGRYTVTEDMFQEHCRLLAGRDDVVVTFDDGHASQMRAATFLEEHGLTATFFVSTADLNKPGFLTSDQVLELFRRGHRIGAHGHTHRFLTGCRRGLLEEELVRPREILTGLLNDTPTELSFPGGRFNGQVLQAAAEAGYQNAWSSEPGTWSSPGPVLRQGRDAVLNNWSVKTMARWLAGRQDTWRAWRYRLLGGAKRVVGDRAYHRMTAHERPVD